MGVKKKNNFDMQRQRGLRGKMGIPLQRYDDSSFNNIPKKNFKRKSVKCGSKSWSLNHDTLNVKGDVEA